MPAITNRRSTVEYISAFASGWFIKWQLSIKIGRQIKWIYELPAPLQMFPGIIRLARLVPVPYNSRSLTDPICRNDDADPVTGHELHLYYLSRDALRLMKRAARLYLWKGNLSGDAYFEKDFKPSVQVVGFLGLSLCSVQAIAGLWGCGVFNWKLLVLSDKFNVRVYF